MTMIIGVIKSFLLLLSLLLLAIEEKSCLNYRISFYYLLRGLKTEILDWTKVLPSRKICRFDNWNCYARWVAWLSGMFRAAVGSSGRSRISAYWSDDAGTLLAGAANCFQFLTDNINDIIGKCDIRWGKNCSSNQKLPITIYWIEDGCAIY